MNKLGWTIAIFAAMLALVLLSLRLCGHLLPLANSVDKITKQLGVVANWLVLLAALSAPATRSAAMWGLSSNAWLELQWYMFAGMVLLGAAYTLAVNEHVRVDLFYGSVSDRTRHWIDLLGGAVFLLPMCIVMIYFTWPWFVEVLAPERGVEQCRRPHSLAGETPDPARRLRLSCFRGCPRSSSAPRRSGATTVHEYAYEKPLQ